MQNNKLLPISLIILALGIMLSSIWLGYSLQKLKPTATNNILTLFQVADYLGITEEEVQGIIKAEKKKLESNGTYTGMMLPYFKINGKMYFSKEQLDEWIKDVSRERKEYNTVNGFVV